MDTEYSLIKETFGTDYIGALRHMRDILLRESDWTQFTDSPLIDSKKTEWTVSYTHLTLPTKA